MRPNSDLLWQDGCLYGGLIRSSHDIIPSKRGTTNSKEAEPPFIFEFNAKDVPPFYQNLGEDLMELSEWLIESSSERRLEKVFQDI
jgi:hypothetical protein